jgi:hypothetical protein
VTAKALLSATLVLVYLIFEGIWRPFLNQLQAIMAAQQLNDHSILGNTMYQWLRGGDLITVIVTIVLVVALVRIWWSEIKRALEA